MSKKKRNLMNKASAERSVSYPAAFFVDSSTFSSFCTSGYTSLDQNPEIMTGVKKIAELIGSMTIHLMTNSEKGDKRLINELSRKIDIDPMPTMTRMHWMQIIVMNLLLYGSGNSVVLPHTKNGLLEYLEPIAAHRVGFLADAKSYSKYKITIDGIPFDPGDLLHFVYNPDKYYLWKGTGITVILKDVANALKQAAATEKGFMESPKPSLIVKVDALTEEFSGVRGREKLLNEYILSSKEGQPWMIPAQQFQVEQVKPLTLADLAISDSVELDKRTVAAIIGVPPFLLGVGDYDRDAWNGMISNVIGLLVKGIDQEFTKKLLINPKWYFKHNILSLYDYDIEQIVAFSTLRDRGIINKNEVRDRLGYEHIDGGDEFDQLENYIPSDMAGDQKKLDKKKKKKEKDEDGEDE